jgi:heat shock protein HtpX
LQTLEQKQGNMWEKIMLPGARIPDPSLLRSHPKTEDRVARLLSLRTSARPVIEVVDDGEPHRPGQSIVPPVRNPRIHVSRFGLWY